MDSYSSVPKREIRKTIVLPRSDQSQDSVLWDSYFFNKNKEGSIQANMSDRATIKDYSEGRRLSQKLRENSKEKAEEMIQDLIGTVNDLLVKIDEKEKKRRSRKSSSRKKIPLQNKPQKHYLTSDSEYSSAKESMRKLPEMQEMQSYYTSDNKENFNENIYPGESIKKSMNDSDFIKLISRADKLIAPNDSHQSSSLKWSVVEENNEESAKKPLVPLISKPQLPPSMPSRELRSNRESLKRNSNSSRVSERDYVSFGNQNFPNSDNHKKKQETPNLKPVIMKARDKQNPVDQSRFKVHNLKKEKRIQPESVRSQFLNLHLKAGESSGQRKSPIRVEKEESPRQKLTEVKRPKTKENLHDVKEVSCFSTQPEINGDVMEELFRMRLYELKSRFEYLLDQDSCKPTVFLNLFMTTITTSIESLRTIGLPGSISLLSHLARFEGQLESLAEVIQITRQSDSESLIEPLVASLKKDIADIIAQIKSFIPAVPDPMIAILEESKKYEKPYINDEKPNINDEKHPEALTINEKNFGDKSRIQDRIYSERPPIMKTKTQFDEQWSQMFGCRIYSSDSSEKRIVLGFEDGGISVFSVLPNKAGIEMENNARQYPEAVTHLLISSKDGGRKKQFLFSAYSGEESSIVVWNFPELKPYKEMFGHEGIISQQFTISNNYLVSCSYDCSMIFWDLDSFKGVLSLDCHESPIFSSSYDQNTETILCGALDFSICVCTLEFDEGELMDCRLHRRIKGVGPIFDLCFIGLDRFISLENSKIRLYDTRGFVLKELETGVIPNYFLQEDEHGGIVVDNTGQPHLLKYEDITNGIKINLAANSRNIEHRILNSTAEMIGSKLKGCAYQPMLLGGKGYREVITSKVRGDALKMYRIFG